MFPPHNIQLNAWCKQIDFGETGLNIPSCPMVVKSPIPNVIPVIPNHSQTKFFLNYTLNTFYLRSYGVKHMVKGHSESERGNPLPPLHGLLFPISSKWDRTVHTTASNWLEQEIS